MARVPGRYRCFLCPGMGAAAAPPAPPAGLAAARAAPPVLASVCFVRAIVPHTGRVADSPPSCWPRTLPSADARAQRPRSYGPTRVAARHARDRREARANQSVNHSAIFRSRADVGRVQSPPVSARGVRRDLPATLSKEREENATIHTCNGPNFVFFICRKKEGGRRGEGKRGERGPGFSPGDGASTRPSMADEPSHEVQ